jgi:hypothetical protein
MDYYLSFPDEAAANKVLYGAEDMPNFANIDIVGVIYKRTGGTDEEPVMAAIPGWHVNVRVIDEDDKILQPFAVTPAAPVRVWA